MTKRHWSAEEFTDSSGTEWTGYAIVRDGRAETPSGERLTPLPNAAASMALSDFNMDRALGDSLALPYGKHEVTFAPNDFLNTAVLRTIVKRLHINNQYLYRCATISATDLPGAAEADITALRTSGDGLAVQTLAEQIAEVEQNGSTPLSGPFFSTAAKKADFDLCEAVASDMAILSTGRETVQALLALTLRTKVLLMKLDLDTTTGRPLGDIAVSSIHRLETIDPQNRNSLSFLRLVDAKISGTSLYILDGGLNLLAKYDISSITNREGNPNPANIYLVDSIQGRGKRTDAIHFNAPTALEVTGEHVYVADDGNRCIKKYTRSLDYLKTFRNGKYAANSIRALSFTPYGTELDDGTAVPDGSLWVLSQSENHLYISILSGDRHITSFQVEDIDLASLNAEGPWDERAVALRFSHCNTNHFYIATNKRTFKLFRSRPWKAFATNNYYSSHAQVMNNIWRAAAFPWKGDNPLPWSYSMEDGLYLAACNKCLSICGTDSVPGDIVFNIQFTYRLADISAAVESYGKDINAIPSEVERECIKICSIMLYNERDKWESMLANRLYPCYTDAEVEKIEFGEYVNPLTFNKVVYKVAQNLIQFKNALAGRLTGFYDTDHLMKFDGLETSEAEIQYFQTVQDASDANFFLHANEPNSILVNRVFECIWNMQRDILRRMEPIRHTTSKMQLNKYTWL